MTSRDDLGAARTSRFVQSAALDEVEAFLEAPTDPPHTAALPIRKDRHDFGDRGFFRQSLDAKRLRRSAGAQRTATHVGQAMAYQTPSKPFVLRAQRETVMLVAAATAATLALSSAIHSHRPEGGMEASRLQAWTGELASVEMPDVVSIGPARITSASLVVPKSEFALPDTSVQALVSLHGCDGSLCTSRATGAPSPPRRPLVSGPEAESLLARRARAKGNPSLFARLNPLNHLPDAAALKRPFAVAGDAVTGWFKRF